mmetsp:Transcript_58637/g.171604  ORF Transcript_58637/g.171604 Transcript_58637/m.171604 type:complete len:209 (+) Transcript_58637:458-1084(+)
MGAPPILMLSEISRAPEGFAASKANVTPLTCAKRPSKRGYWDTEFSKTDNNCVPESCSMHSSSSMGSKLTRSRIFTGPFSMMESARSVPLLRTAKSVFSALRMTSATKFPMFVSFVRMDANWQSRSTAVSPRTTSIAALTSPWHLSTSSFISGSSPMSLVISTCLVLTTLNGLAPFSSVNSRRTSVRSRKSVPLFSTYVPWGPSGCTS